MAVAAGVKTGLTLAATVVVRPNQVGPDPPSYSNRAIEIESQDAVSRI